MTTLYVMMGPPACGKSTLAKNLTEKLDTVTVSPDEVRRELYGDESVQKDHDKVFGLCHDRMCQALLEGKEVVFGFRPEAVRIINSNYEVGNAYKMNCVVELVELLGDNTNVYVDIYGVNSILKVDPHESPEINTGLEFSIPYGSVYLFDKETERRIKLKNDK